MTTTPETHPVDGAPTMRAIQEAVCAKNAPICCPNCNHALDLEVVGKLKEKSVIHWRIFPAPGELLEAKTVGGTLSEMHDLLVAVGKGLKVPTVVVVSGATFQDGAIDFELTVMRFDHATDRQKRIAARKELGGASR
jgi:hypothetical protein